MIVSGIFDLLGGGIAPSKLGPRNPYIPYKR
jgi:hypothetical protein